MSEDLHHNDTVELELAPGAERIDRQSAEGSGSELPPVENDPAAKPLVYEALPSAAVPYDAVYDGITGERIVEPEQAVYPLQTAESERVVEPRSQVEPQPLGERQKAVEPQGWVEADLQPQERQDPGTLPADPTRFEPPFIPLAYTPETTEDTVRQNGLAYSAGIAFFGSVAFTLFLGWIVDVLLGSSPWGIIVGIVIGSIIGFVQFFSITSRIFPSRDTGPAVSPLSEAAKDADDKLL